MVKTGNAIVGVFFIWMSFFFPVFSVIELAERNLLERLPVNLYIFVFVPFSVFIALGIISLVLGRERYKTTSRKTDADDDIFK